MTVLHFLQTDHVALRATGRLIPRGRLAEAQQAKGIVERAQLYARQLEDEVAGATEEGRRAGYEEGLRGGRAAAIETIVGANLAERELLERLNAQLAKLVVSMVNTLIDEVADDERFEGRISAMLKLASDQRILQLHVAPTQVAAALALLAQSMVFDSAAPAFKVVADPSLGKDDVVLESQGAFFNGRLQDQYSTICAAIEEALRAAAHGTGRSA